VPIERRADERSGLISVTHVPDDVRAADLVGSRVEHLFAPPGNQDRRSAPRQLGSCGLA
jgi:hypothetical protein